MLDYGANVHDNLFQYVDPDLADDMLEHGIVEIDGYLGHNSLGMINAYRNNNEMRKRHYRKMAAEFALE